MKITRSIEIKTEDGLTLPVRLEKFEDRQVATVFIDNVPYHIERMSKDSLCGHYKIDTDPDYVPKTDSSNCCVMIAPYSRK